MMTYVTFALNYHIHAEMWVLKQIDMKCTELGNISEFCNDNVNKMTI